nr:MAG TPA: hypothetical protein [Caudoviricetes sp.]
MNNNLVIIVFYFILSKFSSVCIDSCYSRVININLPLFILFKPHNSDLFAYFLWICL